MRRIERKKRSSAPSKKKAEPFFKGLQKKVSIGAANDHYEQEADAMADAVTKGESKDSKVNASTVGTEAAQRQPLSEKITPLVQKAEEEEAQTKVQKQEEEEAAQAKVQRMEEKEPMAKLQKQEEEEAAQAKVQRMEEKEPMAKLQKQEEEEAAQAKLQRMEEKEPQAKLQKQEEEEAQAKQSKKSQAKNQVAPSMEAQLNNRKEAGSKMDSDTQNSMEDGFGADFSGVKIHTDSKAQDMSQQIGAQAFTYGNDIYFNQGKYQPKSPEGKHLLAHELTHTIQQGKSKTAINKKEARGVAAGGNLTKLKKEEDKMVQKQDDPKADTPPPVAPEPQPKSPKKDSEAAKEEHKPETAVPTLVLTPPASLLRGDTLQAVVNFNAAEKGKLNITSWTFAMGTHGTITRDSKDATFQNSWNGVMAESGTLTITYEVLNADGTNNPAGQLASAVTVNDRSGADFTAQTDLVAEKPLGGKPSPPVVFSDLGLHKAGNPSITPNTSAIADGPNKGLTFAESFTADKFKSEPFIHPDASDPSSTFYTFHQQTGILWIEKTDGTNKTKVPTTEYSNLTDTAGGFTFDVPNWESYLKTKNVYKVEATGDNGVTKTLPDAFWGLASNAQNAAMSIKDDSGIRTLLGLKASDGYGITATPLKQHAANFLLPSARILSGTKDHEYMHADHSHRANYVKMIRALDPLRILENKVSSAISEFNFTEKVNTLKGEILKPDHDLVDEAQSLAQEKFVATGGTMAGVNEDPATGKVINSVWNVSGDKEMTN